MPGSGSREWWAATTRQNWEATRKPGNTIGKRNYGEEGNKKKRKKENKWA